VGWITVELELGVEHRRDCEVHSDGYVFFDEIAFKVLAARN